MKFKGQGKINICGFEYKKKIADSRRGGVRAPNPPLYPRLHTIIYRNIPTLHLQFRYTPNTNNTRGACRKHLV